VCICALSREIVYWLYIAADCFLPYTQTSTLVLGLLAVPKMSDFRELLLKRIAAVQEQRLQPQTSPDDSFLADLVTRAQDLAKSLQAQLETEREEKETKVRYLQRKYEEEIASLREELQEREPLGDQSAREVRALLISDMRAKEAKAAAVETQLRAEVERLEGEINALKLQLNASNRDLVTERTQKPRQLEHEIQVKQLQSQIAELRSQLQTRQASSPPSQTSDSVPSVRQQSVSLKSEPREHGAEDWQQQIVKLTEEKEKAVREVELLLQLSSEKEAELTEEAERLRVLNSQLQDFATHSEDWIQAHCQSLQGQLVRLNSVSLNPALDAAALDCTSTVQQTKALLLELFDGQLAAKDRQVEVLHALDILQKCCSEARPVPALHLQSPSELLSACSQLQRELDACIAQRLQDQTALSTTLQVSIETAAKREEALLSDLEAQAREVRTLRDSLSDLQDRHVEEELRTFKAQWTRLHSEMQAAKRHIGILLACIQALQQVISEGSAQSGDEVLRTEMSRLKHENTLLLEQTQTQAQTASQQIASLREEIYTLQGEIRLLRGRLEQFQQLRIGQMQGESTTWKDNCEVLALSMQQLRALAARSLQPLAKLVERGEVEGLQLLLSQQNEELKNAKQQANGRQEQILAAIQDLKALLEQPIQSSNQTAQLDSLLSALATAVASLPALQRTLVDTLQSICGEVRMRLESFQSTLKEISASSQALFHPQQHRIAQTLDSLQSMHDAEIDAIRKEVISMESRFSQDRNQASSLLHQLLEAMNYQQAIGEEDSQEAEKTVQWEFALMDALLQLLESDAIEEVNESSEVSCET